MFIGYVAAQGPTYAELHPLPISRGPPGRQFGLGEGTVRKVSRIKGTGYLVSSASVLLLAVPALKSAQESLYLAACLALGVLSSIGGMILRWRSHRLEQQEK